MTLPIKRKPGPGRGHKHEPTSALRAQVEALAGFGIPAHEICKVVGISEPTLRKHYRAELDEGETKANAAVAQSLFKKATGSGPQSVTAAIFWLKTRAGWKETERHEHEHSGPDKGPIQTEDVSARDHLLGRLSGLAARRTEDRGGKKPH